MQFALQKATTRHFQKTGIVANTNVVFNEEKQTSEPLLNIIDYALWAVQRLLQTGDDRYYQNIGDKIILITDLYDNQTVYSPENPLSIENKL